MSSKKCALHQVTFQLTMQMISFVDTLNTSNYVLGLFFYFFCTIFTVLEPWLLETCVKCCRKQLSDTVLSAIYVSEWA